MVKEILLTQGKVALIDDDDYDLVSSFKWYASKEGNCWYAMRQAYNPIREKIRLHRFLLNPKPNEQCDHINGDGLDNRRNNIRIVTVSQNHMNRKRRLGSSSQFKGVSKCKSTNKWVARIEVKQKHIHLGYFFDEVEAAKAYNVAALKHFREYARINQFNEE